MTTIEQQLIEDPFSFELIENKTEELAALAVSIEPKSLAVIPEEYQTELVCKSAIRRMASSIEFVKKPTIKLCNYAILGSSNVEKILDFIPILDGNFKVILRIMEYVRITSLDMILRTKFPISTWTEALIVEIFSNNCVSDNNLNCFIKFLQESGIHLTPSMTKILRSKYCLSTRLTVSINWTEKDIKKRLESYMYIDIEKDQKVLAPIYISLSEFYKSDSTSQLVILTHTKNITEEMILCCGITYPSRVINICLQRGILTADLLVKIVSIKSHKQKPELNIRHEAYTEDNIAELNKIEFTQEQLKIIQSISPDLAKLCNKNVDVTTPDQIEKKDQIKDQLRIIIKNNTDTIISNYLEKINSNGDVAVLSTKQLKRELDDLTKSQSNQLDQSKAQNGQSKAQNGQSNAQNGQISDHNDIFRAHVPGEKEFIKAVEHNGEYLKFVPIGFRSLPLCLKAYQQNKSSIKYVPTNLIDEVQISSIPIPKKTFQVAIIDKINMKNYLMENWNVEEQLESLKQEHNNLSMTVNQKLGKGCDKFNFIKDGVIIITALILN